MAEDAFVGELADAIDDLQRKLNGLDDGTAKVLHTSTIENLAIFFKRFKSLNLHSSAELDRLVEQAETVLSGKTLLGGQPITRDELRDSGSLRAEVRSRLSAVSASLDGMLVAKPRRSIKRRNQSEVTENTENTAATPAE
jgi:hypothetical protein